MRISRGLALMLLVTLGLPVSWALGEVPSQLDDYVLFAAEELRANGSSIEQGDVGVNDGRLVAARPLIAPRSTVAAREVVLAGASTCAELFTNTGQGGSACGPAQPAPSPLLPDVATACGFPASFPVCDPTQSIVVTHDQTRTLPPGVYGDVVVKGGGAGPATLRLTAGRYVFCGLRVGRGSQVVMDAATDLYIAGDVQLGPGSELGPGNPSLSPGIVQLFVKGARVGVSRRSRVSGKLCAPDATMRVASGAELTGRFVAGTIVGQRMTARGIPGGPTTSTTSTTVSSTTSSTTSTTSSSSTTSTSSTSSSTTASTSTSTTTSTTVPSTTTTTSTSTTTTSAPSTTTTSTSSTSTSTAPTTTSTTSSTSTTAAPATSTTTTSTTTTSSTSTTVAPTTTTTTTTSSTTSTTAPAGVICGPGGVSARITVPYNQIGAPALAGIRLNVGFPAILTIPTIPGTAFVDPSRLTDLTATNGSLLAQLAAGPKLDLVYIVAGTTFPPGDLASALFSCEPGTPVSPSEFTCLVTGASDRVGNEVANPGAIPCLVSQLSAP